MASGDDKKDDKKDKDPTRVDAGRRRLFRMFATPFSAAVKGYQLPPNHTSKNPPVERQVIRPGPDNSLVKGLIGPLSAGQSAGAGFFLQAATANEADIRYTFARGEERIHVDFAQPGVRTGRVIGATRTFAVFVEGTAEPALMEMVARVVLMHANARDQGQLWTTAARSVAGKREA